MTIVEKALSYIFDDAILKYASFDNYVYPGSDLGSGTVNTRKAIERDLKRDKSKLKNLLKGVSK